MSEDATTTAPAEVDNPSVDPAVVQSDAPTPEKGDYDARLRSDPDFALGEVKQAQRKLHQFQSKFKQLGPIVDALGGEEAVVHHLQRLNNVVSNPEMAQLLDEYERTKAVPQRLRSQAPNGDLDAGDDMDEPWTPELRKRDETLSALQSEVVALRSERGVEKVRGFIEQFNKEYPLEDADRQELGDALLGQIETWGKTAAGLEALKSMNYATFQSLALGRLGKEGIRKSILREEALRREGRGNLATDSPSQTTTQARERDTSLSPVEAARKAFAEAGWREDKALV